MATIFEPAPFGDYLLVDLIGTGGMADVFLANAYGAEGFERLVAIKCIQRHWLRDKRFIEMFIDEARLAVQLSNPNIAQVYELGTVDGQYYMAMEYVAGQSLANIFKELASRRVALPVAHAAYLITGVAAALDHAHRRCDTQGRPLKIVHRDVTPHNVLVSYDGAVKVVDFGIAKAENRLTKTEAGTLKGKFAYMSPENARGMPVDQRSDVFAAGILLWEALTGHKLFQADDDFETFDLVRAAVVDPPSKYVPALPSDLDRVALKALAPVPEERYQHASELIAALEPFLIHEYAVFGGAEMSSFMQEHFAAAVVDEAQRRERVEQLSLPRPAHRPTVRSPSRDIAEIEALGRSGTVVLASAESGDAEVPGLLSTTDPTLPKVSLEESCVAALESAATNVAVGGERGVTANTSVARWGVLRRTILDVLGSRLGLWVLGVVVVMLALAVIAVVTIVTDVSRR